MDKIIFYESIEIYGKLLLWSLRVSVWTYIAPNCTSYAFMSIVTAFDQRSTNLTFTSALDNQRHNLLQGHHAKECAVSVGIDHFESLLVPIPYLIKCAVIHMNRYSDTVDKVA